MDDRRAGCHSHPSTAILPDNGERVAGISRIRVFAAKPAGSPKKRFQESFFWGPGEPITAIPEF
jgi:hypothetical protein